MALDPRFVSAALVLVFAWGAAGWALLAGVAILTLAPRVLTIQQAAPAPPLILAGGRALTPQAGDAWEVETGRIRVASPSLAETEVFGRTFDEDIESLEGDEPEHTVPSVIRPAPVRWR